MALPAVTTPKTYDLRISQGSTFTRSLEVYIATPGDVDLTGCTFAAKIRDKFGVSSVVIIILTVTTTAPGLLVGQFSIDLTAAQTAALAVPAATPDDVREALIGVWDLEITSGTAVYRYVQGDVYLSREATY